MSKDEEKRTERVRCDFCSKHAPLWKVSGKLLCDDCIRDIFED